MVTLPEKRSIRHQHIMKKSTEVLFPVPGYLMMIMIDLIDNFLLISLELSHEMEGISLKFT